MLTVLSNTRNASLYLIAAVAITLTVLLARPSLPSINAPGPALIPDTGRENAHDLFRQEELSLYDRPAASSIGGPAFYDYRRGEWSMPKMSVAEAFRRADLASYRLVGTSSIGSASFYEYRRGEWFAE